MSREPNALRRAVADLERALNHQPPHAAQESGEDATIPRWSVLHGVGESTESSAQSDADTTAIEFHPPQTR